MRLRVPWQAMLLAGLAAAVLSPCSDSARADQGAASDDELVSEVVHRRFSDRTGTVSEVLLAQDEPVRDETPRRVTPPAPDELPARPPSEVRRPPLREPSPRELLARYEARRRRRLATIPHMFGDFFGGGGGQAAVTFSPVTITVTDGPFDLFVSNLGGSPGANINPAVPIRVTDGPVGPLLIATSIGNGVDLSGDGQPDSYPISSPTVPGMLPPNLPCPGTWVYTNGSAVFADALGNPQDGSVGQGDGWRLIASYTCSPGQVIVAVPYGGGAVRRFKIAEHSSPQPRDRLFFDFNFFNDAVGGFGDVSRYTFGVERTLFSGRSSVEVRIPFAATLNNEQDVSGTDVRDVEFGNLVVWWKSVLHEAPTRLISAGLGVSVPTGPASRVTVGDVPILQMENDAVHLMPYIGAMAALHERWFWQAFAQLDIDTNGNPVRGDVTGQHLSQFGVLQDATLLFIDAAIGYSLYERAAPQGLTRVSPTAELHYSTTLQDADVASGNGFLIGSPTGRFDVVNVTLGATFLFHDRLSIRPAMVVPVSGDDQRHFDYEAMVQIDWQR